MSSSEDEQNEISEDDDEVLCKFGTPLTPYEAG
jgi:hypothetical protein